MKSITKQELATLRKTYLADDVNRIVRNALTDRDLESAAAMQRLVQQAYEPDADTAQDPQVNQHGEQKPRKRMRLEPYIPPLQTKK